MSDRPGNVIPLTNSINAPTDSARGSSTLFQGLSSAMPRMPAEMGQIAKNQWLYIGKQLEDAGMISAIDHSIFRRYCETYELYVISQRDVMEKGEFQQTPNKYSQLAPWAVARERHAKALKSLEDRLFLNPQARRRVKIDNPDQGDLDL